MMAGRCVRCSHQSRGCPGCFEICAKPLNRTWGKFKLIREHREECGLLLSDYSDYFDTPSDMFEKSLINFNTTIKFATTGSPENATQDVFAASFVAEWPNGNYDTTAADKDNDLIKFNETLPIRIQQSPSSNINNIFSASFIANWPNPNGNEGAPTDLEQPAENCYGNVDLIDWNVTQTPTQEPLIGFEDSLTVGVIADRPDSRNNNSDSLNDRSPIEQENFEFPQLAANGNAELVRQIPTEHNNTKRNTTKLPQPVHRSLAVAFGSSTERFKNFGIVRRFEEKQNENEPTRKL